jgi:GNAT superfamily N-acetyltransferase
MSVQLVSYTGEAMVLEHDRQVVEVVVRPLSPRDGSLVREAFRSLSARTRELRWGVPLVDQEKALAWVGLLETDRHFAVVACVAETGQPVGVGRCVVGDEAVELALTVVDGWQGQGVGGLLLQALVREACGRGISTLTAWVSVENQPAIRLLHRVRGRRLVHRGSGMVEGQIPMSGCGDA